MHSLPKKFLQFPNGNNAIAVEASPETQPDEIISVLQLNSYQAVLLILGGADDLDKKYVSVLEQLTRNIAQIAIDTRSVIIDGGTKSGIMEMMGKGVHSYGYKTPLIGVAPKHMISLPSEKQLRTPLDPDHSHFVLVTGHEWGSETSTLFSVVMALVNKSPTIRSVGILVSGGKVSKNEILNAVRLHIKIIIVTGSGRLADSIFNAWNDRTGKEADAEIMEIVNDGDLAFYALNSPDHSIDKLIFQALNFG